MIINFNLNLSKSQQDMYDLVHDDRYKYVTIIASRQQGKSILMQILCIEWLLQSNNAICYVCRNFVLAKKIYRDLVKIIPKHVIKSSNGSDLFIESIYGSTLMFASAEQGASLRGQTFTHLINDEFAFHKQEQTDGTHLWNDILSPTLKARGRKCINITTPLGKNNIAYDFYLRGLSDNYPEYTSLLKTVYDDGFVTPEQIEEIKRSVPAVTFRREYMCEFDDDGISFFQGYAECFDIAKARKGKCWIGIDISGNGSDATILTSINEYNEVSQYEIKGTLDMKYRQMADLINTINPTATYIEINGLGSPVYNEVRKLVRYKNNLFEWTTTNSSKEEIISDLAVSIANSTIHFEKDNTILHQELSDFIVTVSKTRKLQFQGRASTHDDRVLSLAIALKCKTDFKNLRANNNIFVKDATPWIQ